MIMDYALACADAESGDLHVGFDQWDMSDEEGWSVAHHAVMCGPLPDDFNGWAIHDLHGWTVAHVAARCGHLPEGFTLWTLADDKGRTVAQEAISAGLPSSEQYMAWQVMNGL
jgi:hypothetical protein